MEAILIALLGGTFGSALTVVVTLLATDWQLRQGRELEDRSIDEAGRSAAWGALMPFLMATAQQTYRLDILIRLLEVDSWTALIKHLLDNPPERAKATLRNEARGLVLDIARGFSTCVPDLVDEPLRSRLLFLRDSVTLYELCDHQLARAGTDPGRAALADATKTQALDSAPHVGDLADLVRDIHQFVASAPRDLDTRQRHRLTRRFHHSGTTTNGT
jgi:hypothetical protein